MRSLAGWSAYMLATEKKFDIIVNAGVALQPFLGDRVKVNGQDVEVIYTIEKNLQESVILGYRPRELSKEEINPFAFGNFVFSQSIVTESTRVVNGAEVRVPVVNPVYQHIVTNPTLVELNVTGTEQVLRKIAVYTNEV